MLEIEIQTTDPMPRHLAWKNRLKTEADLLAARLRGVHDDYARRIEGCSDLIKLVKFKNGYMRSREEEWKCHTRGCPICERSQQRKRQGRISAGIRTALEQMPTHVFAFLTLPVNPFPVSQLKIQLSSITEAIQRLVKRKDFRAKGWARLLDVSMLGDQVILSVTLLLFYAPSALTRYYVSRSKWQSLWEQSLRTIAPQVTFKNFKQDVRSILRYTRALAKINLSLVGDDYLADFIAGISKAKFFFASGVLAEWMADRPRIKRKYYPSEMAAIRLIEKNFYAYLPNYEDANDSNEYLRLNELPDELFSGV